MSSKINGYTGPPKLDGGQRSTGISRGDTRADTRPAAADQVSLTDSGQLLVRLERLLEAMPAFDTERVEQIKQAIADGSYTVDAERVAQEVVRMERDLGKL